MRVIIRAHRTVYYEAHIDIDAENLEEAKFMVDEYYPDFDEYREMSSDFKIDEVTEGE